MKMIQNKGFLALTSLLLAALLLCACGTQAGNNTSTTAESTAASTEAAAEEATYTVNVINALGQPVNGAVVTLLKNGVQEKMGVAKAGVATFTLPKGDYTVTVATTTGEDYYYDPASCILSATVTQTTVQLYLKANKDLGETLYEISPVTQSNYIAYKVTEGYTHVELAPNDMSFFVFRPARQGVYKISFLPKNDLSIGYYGSPMIIYSNSLVEVVDNAFEMEIRKTNVGATPESTTPYLIGIQSESAEAKDCILTIEYLREPEFSPVDVDWINAMPEKAELERIQAYLASNPIPEGLSFKDLDVSSESLTVVYNEADGFYHYNTVDGPLVYLRVGSDSPFTEDFVTISHGFSDDQYVRIYKNGRGDLLKIVQGTFEAELSFSCEGLAPSTVYRDGQQILFGHNGDHSVYVWGGRDSIFMLTVYGTMEEDKILQIVDEYERGETESVLQKGK